MDADEKIRCIIREEFERYIPHLLKGVEKQRLTINECRKRYRRRREFIIDLIRNGELEASYRTRGKNGKPQYLVLAASAEKHPLLGGNR